MKPEKLDLDKSKFTIRKVRFSEAPWNDDHIARLLSLVDSFYEDIKAARKKLSFKMTVPYYQCNPDINDKKYIIERRKNPDIKPPATEDNIAPIHLITLRSTVAANKLELLDQLSDGIIKKYKLPPRWQFSVQILILTDTLITPIHGPIYQYVNLPGFQVRLPSEIDFHETPEIDPSIRFANKSFWTQPNLTIIVSENMAITDLAKRLRADPEVKQALEALPKYPRPRNDEQHWGYLVWVLKQTDPNMSFSEIEKQIDETLPEDETLLMSKSAPSYNDLTTYYNRFLKLLAEFEKSSN